MELTATNNDPDVVVKFYLDAVVKLEGMSHALVASMQDVFEYSVFVFCILYVLCGLCVTCAVYFCVIYVLCFVCHMCCVFVCCFVQC